MPKRFSRVVFWICFQLIISTGVSQSCLPEGIIFTTQSQIDSFPIIYPGCTYIEGFVEITGDSIDNLFGLEQIDSIGGDLSFGENEIMSALNGLEGLHKVGGGLYIYQNEKLEGLSELQNLSSVNTLFVLENDQLQDFNGLQKISTLDRLIVAYNPSLKSVLGLDSLGIVSRVFSINDNDSLENLGGISEITFVGESFNISDNAILSELACKINCDTIHGNFAIVNNPMLISINGINGITTIEGSFRIQNNHSLESISALLKLRKAGEWINDGAIISGNSSLSSLHGLDSLERCGDILIISSNAISDLSGLEKLSYIYRNIEISNNPYLTDLSALNNLSHAIGIRVKNNDSLTSLAGLDNIPGSMLQNLSIAGNERLSHCHTQTICEYLLDPFRPPWIINNSVGCNSVEEIEDSCIFTDISYSSIGDQIVLSPNPTSSYIKVENHGRAEIIQIELFNTSGNRVQCSYKSGRMEISLLPEGIYIARITTDIGIIRKKIIKL
ncbi:MAG: T9SS type A sorting domain-containing protein [Bacteroidales bacterium]|jgi:hypothetical protein|nr:T9SS type A sorting domain-containing protein [Bacteroidales bacterium]